MRKVKILEPVDGYAKGDTPELFGPHGRRLVAEGKAEWADKKPTTRKKPD